MKYSQILDYARSLRKNQTPAERIFWANVRNRKFKGLKFNRQFIIEHTGGAYFIADFFCHEHKLIVEIDGGIHVQQVDYDKIREDVLLDMGYDIIRFKNEEILNDWMSVDEKLAFKLAHNPSLEREGKVPIHRDRGELKNLKLKVCGMRDPENIQGLVDIKPDFIGFIFYPKSPRYVDEMDEDFIMRIPLSIHKVGVFVNESIGRIVSQADKYGLEYIQLHGDEDLDFAKSLKAKGLKIIKVFRVMDTIPVVAKQYQGIADYFLFDTASSNYGGSGRHFDWNILRNYNLNIPFLLSGGVQLEDIEKIKEMEIDQLVGIDVNSRFETEPAMKDLGKLRELKAVL
ncbi:DUF559 domain-containing protein [Ekhidna sp.]|uniref:phosphoribosylanthranilate isomerase n=1 Tax=Ekhidna sp. TaxID=2608089 RepID=UPI003CCB81C8